MFKKRQKRSQFERDEASRSIMAAGALQLTIYNPMLCSGPIRSSMKLSIPQVTIQSILYPIPCLLLEACMTKQRIAQGSDMQGSADTSLRFLLWSFT